MSGKKLLLLLLLLISIIMCYYTQYYYTQYFNPLKVIEKSLTTSTTSNVWWKSSRQLHDLISVPQQSINILTWNSRNPVNLNKPWYKEGSVSTNYECDFNTAFDCVYTNDRLEYNESHIVIFNFHLINSTNLPPSRSEDQLWIFFYRESPFGSATAYFNRTSHLFNATSTYMLNSDIPMLYGKFVAGRDADRSTKSPTDMTRKLLNKIHGKNKMVAWFVSHCHAVSGREHYAKELSKYISVDVFGKCGSHKCPRSGISQHGYSACDRMLDRKYKFYLSFENSLCEDYVTEKFFRIQGLDVIPIVLGAADYSKFTAPGTYLDVRNFTSVQRLAAYLHYLSNRTDVYLEYILRKRNLVKVKSEPYLCTVCKYYHNIRSNLATPKRFDLREVWDRNKLCITSKTFYKNITRLNKTKLNFVPEFPLE